VDSAAGFTIIVPASWELDDTGSITYFEDSSVDLYFFGYSWTELDPLEAGDYFYDFEKSRDYLKKYSHTKSDVFDVELADGVIAQGIDFKLTVSGDAWISRVVYCTFDGRVYLFGLDAPADTFQLKKNTIEQVFSSIHLLKYQTIGRDGR